MMVPPHGLEPRLADSKSAVLPLDDGGMCGPGPRSRTGRNLAYFDEPFHGQRRRFPRPSFASAKAPQIATTACVAQENGVGKSCRWTQRTRLRRANTGHRDRAVGSERLTSPAATERASTRVVSRAFQALLGRVRLPLSAPLLALALTACAHQPLTRSCLTQQQYEQLKSAEPPKVHNKLTGKADEDVRPLAGSALELRSWGHALLDTLKICSEKP